MLLIKMVVLNEGKESEPKPFGIGKGGCLLIPIHSRWWWEKWSHCLKNQSWYVERMVTAYDQPTVGAKPILAINYQTHHW